MGHQAKGLWRVSIAPSSSARQHVSRLVHRALSFSKELDTPIGAIKYFICPYNLTKAAYNASMT
jgi:hypothetical protein